SPLSSRHPCHQAVAVGTVPLVVDDPAFDPRLYEDVGSAFVPPPEDLSPEALRQLLDALADPSELLPRLSVRARMAEWEALAAAEARGAPSRPCAAPPWQSDLRCAPGIART
ncbi:unnamed protein product, partial [Prorocentrum cordatum]